MALLQKMFLRGVRSSCACFVMVLFFGLPPAVSVSAQSPLKRRTRAVPASRPSLDRSSRPQVPSARQPELAILNVSAPTTNTTSGANFLIPVTCGNTTGLGVVSFQFDLIFDPAVIVPQMNPIQTFGTISDGMLPTYNVVGGNTLKVVFFTTTARTGAGTLFFFKFTAVGPIGSTSPLTWVNFMWNEGNPGALASPGQVHIVGPTAAGASLGGRVLSAFGQPVGKALVSVTDTHGNRFVSRSSPFGYFHFPDLPTGETYMVSVDSHAYRFGERVITLSGDLLELDLIADP